MNDESIMKNSQNKLKVNLKGIQSYISATH